MPSTISEQIPFKTVSEVLNAARDFSGRVDASELLTGTPTVTEVGTSDLTIANVQTNATAIVINGTTVAIGKAVLWRISGGVAGACYQMQIAVDTDAATPQTLYGNALMDVIADTA